MSTVRGIDVSSVQGRIRWNLVSAQGVRFAYIKCGNGNNGPDPFFAANVAGARAAGVAIGAYHVGFPLPTDPAHPGREPEQQARAHFLQSGGLGIKSGDMPAALDLEWPVPGSPEWFSFGCTTEHVRDWAIAYLTALESLLGRTPVLYNGFPIYWRDIGGRTDARFAAFPLWNVDYRTPPTTPAPWSSWSLQQVSGGGGKLPGGAPVDEDAFNGDEEGFRAFLKSGFTSVAAADNQPVYIAPDPLEDADPEPDAA